jgi:hypothetical protein
LRASRAARVDRRVSRSVLADEVFAVFDSHVAVLRCGGTTHRRFTQAVNEACRVADEYGFFPTEICPLPRSEVVSAANFLLAQSMVLFLFINNRQYATANFSFKKFEHKDTV